MVTPVLDISISTYNRVDKIEALVKEILKVQSVKFSVTVVDDKSSDDTIERLSHIKDKRLHVFCNASNKGAKGNWYETINRGYGKYVLHLLDRDWIQTEYLQKMIEVLEREDFGFGYIGRIFSFAESKNEMIERYQAGREALEQFGFVLVHPSGFFVRKEVWDKIPDKEKFFMEEGYGIYPHSYIFALLAKEYDGGMIKCPMINIVTACAKYKSKFYKHNKQTLPYWWTPDAHKMELEALTRYAYEYMDLSKPSLQSILQFRFHENLFNATVSYQSIAGNLRNAKHYGVGISRIGEGELLRININFVWKYIGYIRSNCRKICDFPFVWKLLEIGWKNMKDIIAYK
ncbi:MAG: glycosyltransferase family 2 protein [Lachnospiraceae bacterium]|nr:glycosyltransferase family 2 protein [Lachnospiraceae bacterium]